MSSHAPLHLLCPLERWRGMWNYYSDMGGTGLKDENERVSCEATRVAQAVSVGHGRQMHSVWGNSGEVRGERARRFPRQQVMEGASWELGLCHPRGSGWGGELQAEGSLHLLCPKRKRIKE